MLYDGTIVFEGIKLVSVGTTNKSQTPILFKIITLEWSKNILFHLKVY